MIHRPFQKIQNQRKWKRLFVLRYQTPWFRFSNWNSATFWPNLESLNLKWGYVNSLINHLATGMTKNGQYFDLDQKYMRLWHAKDVKKAASLLKSRLDDFYFQIWVRQKKVVKNIWLLLLYFPAWSIPVQRCFPILLFCIAFLMMVMNRLHFCTCFLSTFCFHPPLVARTINLQIRAFRERLFGTSVANNFLIWKTLNETDDSKKLKVDSKTGHNESHKALWKLIDDRKWQRLTPNLLNFAILSQNHSQ